MKKLKSLLRPRSKSRGSSGSASSYVEFEEGEIAEMPNIHQAIINGDQDKVKKLLKVELDLQDKVKRTPLYIACQCQEWDVVSMLLDAKCQVDLPDKDGMTPLMKALESKNSRLPLFSIAQANLFVSYGCNVLRVNNQNRTCLHYLALSKCNDRSSVFSTLMNSLKNKKACQRLQDLQDKDRFSALHWAVMSDNVEICKCLIANGANVNLIDSCGRTPLMLSCSSGSEEICKALLGANADINLKDSKGRSAVVLARESSTQRCVPLLEDFIRKHPHTLSSSEPSQSWEDLTEAESDEPEEVEEDLSAEEESSISPVKDDIMEPFEKETTSVTVVTKVDHDEISSSSEEPAFGTVRFKENCSPRPKIATGDLSPMKENALIPTLVKPTASLSSPRKTASNQSSLLKALTKSNESDEHELNLSVSGDQRSSLNRSGNGNRLTHSFDMTSDVVKTSLDSVTSGMTTEWDSATEQSGAYSVPNRPAETFPKTDDDDDWSDGPLPFEVDAAHSLNITIATGGTKTKGASDGLLDENKEQQAEKGNNKEATNAQLSSLVAESVRRVIVGEQKDESSKQQLLSTKTGESELNDDRNNINNPWDADSDLSEIVLPSANKSDNERRVFDTMRQTQPTEELLNTTRPSYIQSQTSISQASSRWDTDEFSQEFGTNSRLLSPGRANRRADDDTDVSSEVDDDDHNDVAAEMSKLMEGSSVGSGGNWLGANDRSHLPPLREVEPLSVKTAVTEPVESISRSRRSSSSSLNQQSPADWLGIGSEDITEVKVRKNSPVSVIAVTGMTSVDDDRPAEAFAGASEIAMPSFDDDYGLTSTKETEMPVAPFSAETDTAPVPMQVPLKSTIELVASPKIQSYHLSDSGPGSPQEHAKTADLSTISFSRGVRGTDEDDDDDVVSNEEGENGDIQSLINNLLTLSSSITDSFQLTKVQDAIRQLSARCHADERKITSLETENKMLRDDMVLLEQKLDSVNSSKSSAEKSCAQLELKISSLEAEQVADARKNSSASERLRIQLQESEFKITRLEEENRKLERERNQLEAKLLSNEGIVKQIEAERDFAKQQQTLQQQQLLSVSSSNRDELRAETARLMEENTKLTSRLEDSSRNQKRSELELESIRNELVNARATIRVSEQRISEVHRSGDDQTKRLNEELNKKDVDIAKLTEKNRNLHTQLDTTQNKVLRIESELSNMSRMSSERAQQLQSVTDEARISKLEANTERDHARKLEVKNESLEQRVLDTERRIGDLQRQLDDANHALTAANRKSSGAGEMYSSGPSPLDTRSLSLMEMRCHELLEAKSRLTEDLVRMEAAKKSAEQEAKHASSRLVDAEKRVTQLEMNLESSQRSLDDANRKLDRFSDDSRRAQTELCERNVEVDKLRRELSTFHEAASDLVGRSTTAATVSELRTRLKVAEDEIKAKEAELTEVRNKVELRDHLSAAEMNKLKSRADDARQLWEQEVKTKAGVGQMLVEAERRRDSAESDLLIAKNETHRLEDQLRLAEKRLEDERNRVGEVENKLTKTKAKLGELKIKLVGTQGYDDKLADLSRQIDQQRVSYEERINLLKKQIEDARKEVEAERCLRDRVEADRRGLEVKIARVASLETQISELMRQKAVLEADFAQYRDTISRTHVERSVMDCKMQDLDAKLRAEFDTKVAQFHLSLADLDREREHTDELRMANDQSRSALLDLEKQQLVEELQRVRSAYNSLVLSGGTEQPQQQNDQPQQPITSTPISTADAPSALTLSPGQDGNASAQAVSRRLLFDRLQPVLGNEHLSKLLSSQLINRPHNSTPSMLSTSIVTSRLLNSSAGGRLPTSLSNNQHMQRGSVLSASFHYSVPTSGNSPNYAYHRAQRRDFSIEGLRAQLDRAVALGLSNKPMLAAHSMI